MKSASGQVYDAIMAERQQARMELVYDSFNEGEVIVGDIQAGFPGEDIMSGLIDGLQGLHKKLRGGNKALLSKLIEEAEALRARHEHISGAALHNTIVDADQLRVEPIIAILGR